MQVLLRIARVYQTIKTLVKKCAQQKKNTPRCGTQADKR